MATMTIAASQDTFYGSTYSEGPNGTATYLLTGGYGDWYYSYVQFDISSMPASSEVSSVLLYIYVQTPGTNDSVTQIRRVTSTWNESTLSRTVLPTEDTTTRATLPTTAGGSARWISCDITALAKEWKDGTYSNYGIKLHPTNNSNAVAYLTSLNNGSGNSAYLSITYTPKSFIPRGVWIN